VILSFHPCFATDQQIILGDRSLDHEDLSLVQRAEAIILPQSCPYDLYRACLTSSAHIFPDYGKRFRYPGKTGQVRLFKTFGFHHPRSLVWSSVASFRAFKKEEKHFPHEIPYLIKADMSHEGEGVFLIEDRDTLEASLNRLSLMENSGQKGFISQEFVRSEGSVLRAVILGHQIFTYWKRPERSGEVITTISRGARIDKEWRGDLQSKARGEVLAFSKATRINLAAIDFVCSLSEPEPPPLFLEINYYFGRRGLGGSERYYRTLHEAIREWLKGKGLDPRSVTLV
jgi:ribosomal protein S6--L-glutamate ligase